MSIAIRNISKTFGGEKSVQALREINIEVNQGELFGLIGPDGAGKTTLFRILTTLLLADEGNASVRGFDVVNDYKKIRSIVGYMPGKFSLYQDLTVRENLDFFATIFNTTIDENYHLIEDIYVQLEPFEKRRAGDLSGGMKQKLALCCALIHKPEVLFLDEPTTGVDVVSRREFWDMLKDLKAQGITIFVSTPYMDEATMCDRIALIQEGKILSISSPQGLLENFQHELWGVQTSDMYQAFKDLKSWAQVKTCYTFGARHHVQVDSLNMPQGMNSFLQQKNHKQISVERIKPTVEDCFMDLMTA